MKALVWHGKEDVRCDKGMADPKIENPRDAIVKITATAICGSDLHLYDGYMPTMESGDVLGHEPMGEVVEVGSGNKKLKVGDRVVVPFTISAGAVSSANRNFTRSAIPRTGTRRLRKRRWANLRPACSVIRTCSADLPAARRNIYACRSPMWVHSKSRTIRSVTSRCSFSLTFFRPATWPRRTRRLRKAIRLRSGAIDRVPERLRMAEEKGKAEIINFGKTEGSVYDRLMEMTGGRGPDRCIDAVGAEAHGTGSFDAVLDKAKAAVFLATDRAHVLRAAIMCCRKGGTVSIPGVYIGMVDKMPMGAAMNKGLTLKMGQTHVPHYHHKLLERIEAGEIDPSFVVTHSRPLEDGPELYKTFREKEDGCIKVVLKP